MTRLLTAAIAWALAASLLGAQATGVHPLSGRRYAQPMSVEGAGWLERAERQREEDTERALRLLRIEPGSTVADVGAGSGYFTVRLARLVGPSGKVYANDLQQGMLDIIRRRVEQDRIRNVELILGSVDDPRLPRESVDLALMVDVYHEFSQPQAMLRRLREALKPGGRLVLLEYRAEDPAVPIRPEHKMTVAQARLEVEAEGYSLTTVNGDLPWQHLLVFTLRDTLSEKFMHGIKALMAKNYTDIVGLAASRGLAPRPAVLRYECWMPALGSESRAEVTLRRHLTCPAY